LSSSSATTIAEVPSSEIRRPMTLALATLVRMRDTISGVGGDM
jgi:hypothetical protein